MKFCGKCGFKNKDIYNFCTSCGSKLEAAAEAPSYSQNAETESSSECNITFKRPAAFGMAVNLFHIKVDGVMNYELKNGGEVTVKMKPGNHSVEITVFGILNKTTFNFNATNDVTFICKPNPATTLSVVATPVKVTDSTGRQY